MRLDCAGARIRTRWLQRLGVGSPCPDSSQGESGTRGPSPHPHRSETTMKRRRPLSIEQLEARSLSTLVFVFNGNGFGEATPNQLTQSTAARLESHGDRAIQLTMPAMNGPGPFYQVAREVRSLSKGRPIGLIGFSARRHTGVAPGWATGVERQDRCGFLRAAGLERLSGVSPWRSRLPLCDGTRPFEPSDHPPAERAGEHECL